MRRLKRVFVAASLCAVSQSASAGGTAPKSVPNATTNEAQKVVQGPATEDPVGIKGQTLLYKLRARPLVAPMHSVLSPLSIQ